MGIILDSAKNKKYMISLFQQYSKKLIKKKVFKSKCITYKSPKSNVRYNDPPKVNAFAKIEKKNFKK